jgi:DNA polymerase I-like protein with 3'-5' exonuclease and polymerase domains
MKIKEYGTDTTYLILFSNGIDEKVIQSIGNCVVIDMECSTQPKTKKVKAPIYEEIEEYNPSRVLTVGTIASKFMLDTRFSKIDRCHGGLFMLDNGCIVVPTFDNVNSLTVSFRDRDIERFKTLSYTLPEYLEIYDIPTRFNGDVYIDIETDSLEANSIISIQLCDDRYTYYIHNPSISLLTELFYKIYHHCRADYKLIGHNLISFDLPVLERYTGKIWLDIDNIYDTMLIAHNRGLSPVNLKHLTSMYTDLNNPEAYQIEVHSYDKVYAVADVNATYHLFKRLVQKGIRDIDNLTMRTAITFQKAHQRGIAVDKAKLASEREKVVTEIKNLHSQLMFFADINWNANKEVSNALVEYGVPLKEKTASGTQYSVASSALEPYRAYDIVNTLLRYRELNKLLSTFYDKLTELTQEKDTIHPTMRVDGTETGRSSCNNPNAQQFTSEIKDIFISRFNNGSIAQFDLAQSELRCAVLVSGDGTMAEALKGSDYHKTVASNAFGVAYDEVTKEQRKIAKIISFGSLLYGGSAKGIARQTGASEDVLEKAVLNVKKTFTKLSQWQDKQIDRGVKTLKVLSPYGFLRDLTLVKEYGYGNGLGNVKRTAMNTPIQGLSAFICYELCNYISDRLEALESKFIIQVHDSVFIDVYPGEEDRVTEICKEAFRYLNYTPLAKLSGWGKIDIEGELTFNKSMKDVSEEVIKLTSKKGDNEQ